MREELLIRPIRPADNGPIAEVLSRVRREFGLDEVVGRLLEPEEADLYGYSQGPGSFYWVVEESARVVGGAGIGPLDGGRPGTCELQRMYFLPELRGRGMGAVILDRCLDKARELGYRECYAETMDFMASARRLYEKSGFRSLPSPLGETGHGFTTAWYLLEL